MDIILTEKTVPQPLLGPAVAGAESEKKSRPSVATQLVEFARDIKLVHTPEGRPFAIFKRDSHLETWELGSRAVRDWLARQFYEATGGAPNSQAVQDALAVLRGRAQFDGQERAVSVRLAADCGVLYLDLGNPAWQVVEIGPAGWRILNQSPVLFRRPRGMAALPLPERGGNIDELRPFVNCRDEDWPLLVAWLLGAFMAAGPYPALMLSGEQGSAKSFSARVLRSLVDPSTVPLRAAPRDERDLVIAASNSWVVALDNLSHLSDWVSDALCRLATGAGFATRELYSDSEEALFAPSRPIILNGIGDIATRPDLLDRAIIVSLPAVGESKRRAEAGLFDEFEAARPRILGAVLDSIACALRQVDTVSLPNLPRMADFTRWAVAALPSLSIEAEDFLGAYAGNRAAVHELALETSPVAAELVALVAELPQDGTWEGTAGELLDKLNARTGENVQRRKDWPRGAQVFGNALARLAPNLRALGVDIEKARSGRRRLLTIRKAAHLVVIPVTAVTSRSDGVTTHDNLPAQHDNPQRVNQLGNDGCDDDDNEKPTYSCPPQAEPDGNGRKPTAPATSPPLVQHEDMLEV